MKFTVCDANVESVGTQGVVSSFKMVGRGLSLLTLFETAIELDPVSTTPFSEFRWSEDEQQWIFNLNTKDLSRLYYYEYEIRLDDGSVIPFSFKLK